VGGKGRRMSEGAKEWNIQCGVGHDTKTWPSQTNEVSDVALPA
jgi:hypothetical protein